MIVLSSEDGLMTVPSPRCCHSSNLVGECKVLVFGGRTSSMYGRGGSFCVRQQDVWLLDLRRHRWLCLRADPLPPINLTEHASWLHPYQNRLSVWGGASDAQQFKTVSFRVFEQ